MSRILERFRQRIGAPPAKRVATSPSAEDAMEGVEVHPITEVLGAPAGTKEEAPTASTEAPAQEEASAESKEPEEASTSASTSASTVASRGSNFEPLPPPAPFAELGLSPETVSRLESLGFNTAFPVQSAVVPAVLESNASLSPNPPKPILVGSHTGSGKTLAYCAPIVDSLLNRRIARIRAVVVLPTKVLAQQVQRVFEQVGPGLRVMALKPERALMKEASTLVSDPPDVIITAPGRLVEHVMLNKSLLDDLKFVVIDEADRLLGQNFQDWQSSLSDVLAGPQRPPSLGEMWRKGCQVLVFSATLTTDPGKLASLQIGQDARVFAEHKLADTQFALPETLVEEAVNCKQLALKPYALVQKLTEHVGERCIVFARSNESAARLAALIPLVANRCFGVAINAQRCSGEMRPHDRRRVLRAFAESQGGDVLVCTDLIARGIDMEVDVVMQYDVSSGAREYVHRVGRTARAGASGLAITFLAPGEAKHFQSFQNLLQRTNELTYGECDSAPESYDTALSELGKIVQSN